MKGHLLFLMLLLLAMTINRRRHTELFFKHLALSSVTISDIENFWSDLDLISIFIHSDVGSILVKMFKLTFSAFTCKHLQGLA